MGREEINELLELKHWSETKLAAELHLSSAAIYKWLRIGHCPEGPAEILMRQWLAEARAQNGRKKVGAK